MKEHQEVAVLFVDVIVWDQLEHIYITTASDVMESMVDLEEQLEVAINSGSAWLGQCRVFPLSLVMEDDEKV